MSMVILSEDKAREVRALLLEVQQTASPEVARRVHDMLPSLYPAAQRARVEQMRERLEATR